MREEIKEWVQSCEQWQRNKAENVAYLGLLQPLDIPTQVWTDVCMDFIEGLPKSEGKNVIMVVLDWLSKYAHFLTINHPYTAVEVAKLYFDQVVKLHKSPKFYR